MNQVDNKPKKEIQNELLRLSEITDFLGKRVEDLTVGLVPVTRPEANVKVEGEEKSVYGTDIGERIGKANKTISDCSYILESLFSRLEI